MLFKRLGLDLDRYDWPVAAAALSAIDAALFAVSRVVDLVWFPQTSYAFFAATLAFLALVWVDALSVGMRRAWLWAGIATFLPIIGTIPYARRRRALRRAVAAG
jgi:hypothetical protein